jgi:hypothetical protein
MIRSLNRVDVNTGGLRSGKVTPRSPPVSTVDEWFEDVFVLYDPRSWFSDGLGSFRLPLIRDGAVDIVRPSVHPSPLNFGHTSPFGGRNALILLI